MAVEIVSTPTPRPLVQVSRRSEVTFSGPTEEWKVVFEQLGGAVARMWVGKNGTMVGPGEPLPKSVWEEINLSVRVARSLHLKLEGGWNVDAE